MTNMSIYVYHNRLFNAKVSWLIEIIYVYFKRLFDPSLLRLFKLKQNKHLLEVLLNTN